tara:strand:- start:107 stop:598 length:492 start_codon:yes stop_codon:yes gene_type:complete
MFVCTGNICRSPLAHRLLEKEAADRGLSDRLSVESSGTGGWHIGEDVDARMRRTAARRGVDLHHPARQLERRDLTDYDLLFAMARGHYRDIHRMGNGSLDGKLYVFRQFDPEVSSDGSLPAPRSAPDVPDPYYGGPDGFENVYDMVERTCRRIVDEIAAGSLP